MKFKIFLVALISIVTIAGFYVILEITYNNRDVRIRNSIVAKEQNREAVYDETWKSIKQIAQVSEKYAEDFKKVYPEIMAGRYGNGRGGSLLSFVTESNPKFDINLYSKLTNVIEAKRSEFTTSQKQLIDLKREHDNLLMTFPGSYFINNKEKVEIQVISSDRSKGAVSTGIDNDVSVF